MKNIAIIIGTRPEAIKMIPLYKCIKESDDLNVLLISTGQHKEMLDNMFAFFNITPDVELSVMTRNQNMSQLTAKLAVSLQNTMDDHQIDLMLVQGDTTSATIAALISFYNKVAVGHIEAGLRTNDKFSPFPEEINRRLIGVLADYHFTPTKKAETALQKECVKNIFTVGNTVIDSLKLTKTIVEQNEMNYELKFEYIKSFEKLILVTGHRRENFGRGFQNICKSILRLSKKYPNYLFLYPVHLNPNVRSTVVDLLQGVQNIKLIDPIPYDEMVYLMSNSFLILTDSGGIQEEAPSLNIPLLVMRDTTERTEGIDAGCARLVGTDSDKIVNEFIRLVSDNVEYNKMANAENPYGDGTSSEKIVKIIKSLN